MASRENTNQFLLWLMGLGLFAPLFFRLDGSVYADANVLTESGGVLSLLPLPVSILVCFATLLLLIFRISTANAGVFVIVGTATFGILSVVSGADGVTGEERKLMMLAQVLMPMAGLVLGQLVQDDNKIIAKAFLLVLYLIVPMQLILTLAQERDLLTHYFYIFSIYSHIQFVTLIFVSAFVYASASLWCKQKWMIVILAVLMFFYVTRSYSFLTTAAYVLAVLVFIALKLRQFYVGKKSMIAAGLLILVTVAGAMGTVATLTGQRLNQIFLGKFTDIANGQVPTNVQERFDDWKRFGEGIIESNKTIFVGHPEPMPREIRSSPHNWYIEQTYTFGVIALIPILAMIVYTGYLCLIRRKLISPQTWWLASIVFYLVVIDSNFKVTLRQPYPGLFTYFLWGMLFAQLRIQEDRALA